MKMYHGGVTLFLHRLSAFTFYLLGLSFFGAYMFLRNDVGQVEWPAMWLQTADLPLALTSMIYGGTSLYLSLKNPDRPSRMLGMIITIPLVALFGFLVYLNFYRVIAGI